MALLNVSFRPVWREYRRVPLQKCPYQRRAWLLDRGSLTKRLIRASHGEFRVNVRRQHWGRPHLDERQLLNLPHWQYALIREVELICHDEVWVTARSIIPLATLSGAEKQLACLGERPLGEFLFKAKTMRRGPLQIAAITPAAKGHAQDTISARRSVFYIHGKPILVSEFFMAPVFK
jgi:chorismate--pyruvate lyase